MKALSGFALCAALLAASALQAVPILPGQLVPNPEQLANPREDANILAEQDGSFVFSTPDKYYLRGEYEQGVLVDPFSTYCGECLAFFYRVDVDSNPNIEINLLALLALGATGFEGYETSVG